MAARQHILVIDDTDDVRRMVMRQLDHLGFEATGARNGEEGLQAVADRLPDAVVCDLRMPHLDGLGVLSALRERYPLLPVVVMSGQGLLEDAVNALKLGAWDYLTKPLVGMAALQLALGKVLEKAHLLRENQRQRERLEAVYRQLAEDQEAGRQLQVSLLPENGRRLGTFTLTRELLPSSYLSGDFLDAFSLGPTRWGFYFADVAGHGVPSALVTVMLRTLVDRQVREAHAGDAGKLAPARLLGDLNAALLSQGHEKHVALFYGLVDEERNELRCANAGCFPWPLLVSGGRTLALELPGMPLGLMPTASYEERSYELSADAVFVACTDGLFDARGGTHEQNAAALAEAALRSTTAGELVRALELDASPARPDDVAVLMLKRGGAHAVRPA